MTYLCLNCLVHISYAQGKSTRVDMSKVVNVFEQARDVGQSFEKNFPIPGYGVFIRSLGLSFNGQIDFMVGG